MLRITTIILALLISTRGASFCQETFSDDFNRPDGAVGNGWLDTMGNVFNLEIIDSELSSSGTNGSSGIYRPFAFSDSVRIQAVIKETTHPAGRSRFDSGFRIFNNGSLAHGYGIRFERTSASSTNSTVRRVDGTGGAEVDRQNSTFQYDMAIVVDFVIHADGRIAGTVTEGAESFSFNFPAHSIVSSGTNFSYAHGLRLAGAPEPRMDDLSLQSPVPVELLSFNIE